MPRYPINPNLFQYDDGTYEDLSTQSGLGVGLAGQEQNRQRRASVMDQNWQQMMQPGQVGPLKGLMSGLGLGGNTAWDGFFGAMQGKENAVASQGGNLDVDVNSIGNWKQEPLYNPMWDITKGEKSAVGEAFKDSQGNIHYRRRSGPLQGLRGY